MMKKILLSFLVALTIIMGGCSKEDDGTVVKPGNDTRPAWQAPANYGDYEQFMSVLVILQDELQPYVSTNDLLCAKVNGEVRGVAAPDIIDAKATFSLTIAGNGNDASIELCFYSDRLNRIFTLSNWTVFDASVAPMGTESLYKPAFPL